MSREDDRTERPLADEAAEPGRDATDPTDPLAVLGNELRVRILRTLADADEPLAFSELRRRTDVRDTGRFNYHLGRLAEYFVTETDDGYALARAGSRVVDLADAAGVDDRGDGSPDLAAVDSTGECPVCGDEDCERLYHVHLDGPGR